MVKMLVHLWFIIYYIYGSGFYYIYGRYYIYGWLLLHLWLVLLLWLISLRVIQQASWEPVSYTHLTLPTSDLV